MECGGRAKRRPRFGSYSLMTNDPLQLMTPYHRFVAEFERLVREGNALPLGNFAAPPRTEPSANAPKALFFAPHPDDETIVGGFALRLKRETGMNLIN